MLCNLAYNHVSLVVADISIAAVDLMQELTDVDTLNESDEGANALIAALVSGRLFSSPVTF